MDKAVSPVFNEMLPAAGLELSGGPICLEDYVPSCMNRKTDEITADLYVQLAD